MTGSSDEQNKATDEVRDQFPDGDAAQQPFPNRGRLMGLDFGTRRIGVAVSDPEQSIASPLDNYTRRNTRQDADYLRRLVDEYRVVGLVVGLPVHMSGEEGEKAREARRFGQWAAQVTGRPVRFWDERHTTALAEDYLRTAELSRKKRQARLDKLAAQIMLQSYLDAEDRDRPPPSLSR